MTENALVDETAFTEQSLYLMLMYAWRLWPGGHAVSAGNYQTNSPTDLIAKLLSDSVQKAYSSGLQRDYVSVTEETLLPSGRILISETLKNRSQRRAELFVERDTFSVNCVANKILREAVKNLLSLPLKNETRLGLNNSLNKLSKVADEEIDQRVIRAEIFKSRRRDYRIGLSIALTLKQSKALAPLEQSDLTGSKPVFSDESLFRSLFEEFLREFYRHHLNDRFVGGRRYRWNEEDSEFFPVMRTDINIESENSVLVIDAKCTPKVVTQRKGFSKQTLNSDHLYQIFTYMSHCQAENPNKCVKGLLIYPLYSSSIDETGKTPAGSLRAKTINFKRNWEEICDELLELAFE